MKFDKQFNKFFVIGVLGLILLGGLITACGSSDSTGSAQIGTVAVLLTDSPTEQFSAVYVTVNEVSLLSDERGHVTIFSGPPRQVNLLALQDVEDLFTVHESVPAGTYNKIRLQVSDPRFVPFVGDPITGEHIHLVANGKVDLIPDHPFHVSPGETLTIRLDIDADKSIMIHPTSSGDYILRPVVFVDVLNQLPSRLVDVSGVIDSIDPDTRSFLLRRSEPIFHALNSDDEDRPHLVRVAVSNDTHIFDASGQPGSFDALAVDQQVHVRGLLTLEGGFHIDARLIEIGQFIRLHGLITIGVEMFDGPACDRFILRVDSAQLGIPIPEPLSIRLGAPLPITEVNIAVQLHNETLIFEAGTHRRLTCGDLVTGKRVWVEGVLDLLDVPTEDLVIGILHAAVIVVKPTLENHKGTIDALNLGARTFNLTQTLPCDPLCLALPILEPILVQVEENALILRIGREEDNSLRIERILFDDLKNGAKAEVFGHLDESGIPFHAQDVIMFATQPIP